MNAALLAAVLSAALPCSTDLPGPNCPPPGVRHLMVGVVDGERVTFQGWHDAQTGRRLMAKGEDPGLDDRLANQHSKLVGDVVDYGVELPRAPRLAPGPRLRTNDAEFGERWNAATEAERNRPCPNPGPCPEPNPEPTPEPAPVPVATPGQHLAYILAFVLGAAAFFVILGALLVGLLPRKA